MTEFFAVFGILIVALAAATVSLFRKGGVYNPIEQDEIDQELEEALRRLPEATVEPVEPPVEPTPTPAAPAPKKVKLEDFCLAIRDHEGKPGDANYTNNNAGNFRCSPVGYLPKYGKVLCTPGGFAKFPTPQLGWEYLLAAVHHRIDAHPTWTCQQFFNNYAPKSDGNDPVNYAKVVSKRVGITPDTVLSRVIV